MNHPVLVGKSLNSMWHGHPSDNGNPYHGHMNPYAHAYKSNEQTYHSELGDGGFYLGLPQLH